MKPVCVCDSCWACVVVFQLIEGASAQQREALGIMTPDCYYYLNQSGTYKVDGTNDSKDFQETMVRKLIGGIQWCSANLCLVPGLLCGKSDQCFVAKPIIVALADLH